MLRENHNKKKSMCVNYTKFVYRYESRDTAKSNKQDLKEKNLERKRQKRYF